MNRPFLLLTFAALAALVGIPAVSVLSQQPAPREPLTVYEAQADGTFVERPVDAKVIGQMHRGPLGTTVLYDDGRSVSYTPPPQDAESQKLLEQEQALAQEVRRITGNLESIDAPEAKQAEWKAEMRAKLVAIFDLQQQRRNREIAKIEERLGKLKETLKKRDAAKDSIVDRRLQTLTGGVDELGWEDSFGGAAIRYGQPNVPMTVPRFDPNNPGNVPPPPAPRAGAGPIFPVPELPRGAAPRLPGPVAVPPAPATSPAPPVAPAPAAVPAPAASR